MNLFSTTAGQCIWNTGIQGAGLKGGNNMSAQSEPPRADAKRTPSGLGANPERTTCGPKADADFEKRTHSGPRATPRDLKANLGSAFGVHSGVRLGLVGTE